METLLDKNINYLPSFESTLFIAIATYQLAFVYLKRKISILNINCVMHDEIYVKVLYISQISTKFNKIQKVQSFYCEINGMI